MLNMRVLGVAHLSSQLRSTQPTPLSIRFQFPNLHRQLNVSDLIQKKIIDKLYRYCYDNWQLRRNVSSVQQSIG